MSDDDRVFQIGAKSGNPADGYVLEFSRQGGPTLEVEGPTLTDALGEMHAKLEKEGLTSPGYVA